MGSINCLKFLVAGRAIQVEILDFSAHQKYGFRQH